MARTAINPVVLSSPSPQGLTKERKLAEDSKTWKRGELCLYTSGTVTPLVATGSTAIYGIFAEDQATATSTSTVEVYKLEDGTKLRMFVMTNGVAATAATAAIGTKYGAEGLANVSYLDTGTANGQFEVDSAGSTNNDLEDAKSDMDAAPGVVEVTFRALVS